MQITIKCDNIYELERIARSLVNGFGTGAAEEPELTEAEKAAAEVLKMTEQKMSVKEALDAAIRKDEAAAPEPEEEPECEAAPPMDARKAEKVAKKQHGRAVKFDYGKLGALLDGGWKVEKIADEYGLSVKAIYYHMKKLREMQKEKSR